MDEIEMMQIKNFVKEMDKNQRIVYYAQKKKSAGIAVLLSFIIPGAGQMYLGKVGKGLILLIANMISVAFIIVIIGLITTPIIWAYSIYDAYKSAKDYNAQLYSIIFSKDEYNKNISQ